VRRRLRLSERQVGGGEGGAARQAAPRAMFSPRGDHARVGFEVQAPAVAVGQGVMSPRQGRPRPPASPLSKGNQRSRARRWPRRSPRKRAAAEVAGAHREAGIGGNAVGLHLGGGGQGALAVEHDRAHVAERARASSAAAEMSGRPPRTASSTVPSGCTASWDRSTWATSSGRAGRLVSPPSQSAQMRPSAVAYCRPRAVPAQPPSPSSSPSRHLPRGCPRRFRRGCRRRGVRRRRPTR
jgi:hypothetical protein